MSAIRITSARRSCRKTNCIERVDPRVVRGGRFSEKIEISTPDDCGYAALLRRALGNAQLAPGVQLREVVERLRGVSPADLEAIVSAAKRSAMKRITDNAVELPPIELCDIEQGVTRVSPIAESTLKGNGTVNPNSE